MLSTNPPTERQHRPTRTCVGCRGRKLQSELIRLRRRADGTVVPALGRKGPFGRSAYVCASKACFDQSVRRRAIERTLAGPHNLAVRSDAHALWTAILQELEREVASLGVPATTSQRVRQNALVTLLRQLSGAGKGA